MHGELRTCIIAANPFTTFFTVATES